jgi:xanthine dehydrogenase small subunit
LRPTSLAALLQQRATFPKAQVVAGTTDVGLWVTKQHKRFAQVLDVTATRELQRVETYPHHIAIGAAVSLTDAFAALVQERPQLKTFGQRFAGLPVRNSGTLGGNVANGSPIGDSMPLLIALGVSVVLMRWKKTKTGGEIAHRELRLEDLYTGYRTNVMRPDELLCWIKVPRPTSDEFTRVYKISKRFDDDISAVCLAIQMTVKGGVVQQVSIGAGGVAATPARARQTEAALLGQPWNADTVMTAAAALRAEFQPISDMRASAAYRHTVLGNLLQRFWLESQGQRAINLESVGLEELTA